VKQRSIKAYPEGSQDRAPWNQTHKPTPQHNQPKASSNQRDEPFCRTQRDNQKLELA